MLAHGAVLGDEHASEVLERLIVGNPKVTDEMLLRLSRVPLAAVERSESERADILARVPSARDLPSHVFCVALMSAVTGLSAAELSEKVPDLGLAGTPSTVLFAPSLTGTQRSTALHDFSDFLTAAGVKGLNEALWGAEGTLTSALISSLSGLFDFKSHWFDLRR